jgi:hypothetical protein
VTRGRKRCQSCSRQTCAGSGPAVSAAAAPWAFQAGTAASGRPTCKGNRRPAAPRGRPAAGTRSAPAPAGRSLRPPAPRRARGGGESRGTRGGQSRRAPRLPRGGPCGGRRGRGLGAVEGSEHERLRSAAPVHALLTAALSASRPRPTTALARDCLSGCLQQRHNWIRAALA